jgi:hypothetical protein
MRKLFYGAIALALAVSPIIAQPPPPIGPRSIPVGGELLIPIITIAGIGYGIYKLRSKK